ncbi:S41 family peptidase [Bacteroidota bacterium]
MMKTVLTALLLILPLSLHGRSELTDETRVEMIDAVCELLREHYVFPDVAEKLCDTLHVRLEKGYYNVNTYDELSDLLSRDLKSVNQDGHLNVWWIPPDRHNQNTEKVDPIVRQLHIIRTNAERGFDFKKVEILEGNIGYLELTKFKSIPDPKLERMLEGTMNFLSNCSAFILDLRRNNGGNYKMIQKFLSYFFEKPVKITGRYTRPSGGVKEIYTRDDVDNKHLFDIPLYVLVSSRTVSGPEQVAYDLQALNRAIIIGEHTKGAANPSRFHRIKEKLLVCIPYGYAVNPVTGGNWEGTGITPDIIVPADSALPKAIELATIAAEDMQKKEEAKVDSLIVVLQNKMKQVESLLQTDFSKAEELFSRILDEFFEIEYMNQYLLLEWLDQYKEEGNTAALEMIARQGVERYPEDDRFYSWLGDTYYEKGDLEKALEAYQGLMLLNPNDVRVKSKIEEIRNRTS